METSTRDLSRCDLCDKGPFSSRQQAAEHERSAKHQRNANKSEARPKLDEAAVVTAITEIIDEYGRPMPLSLCCDALYSRHPDSKAILKSAGGARALCEKHSDALKFTPDTGGGVASIPPDRVPETSQAAAQAAAGAFYAELASDLKLRKRCQDRTLFKSEYETWREESGHRASFGTVFFIMQRNKWIVPMERGGDASVVVWAIDKHDGATSQEQREVVARRVKANRTRIEANKGSVHMDKLTWEECYRPGSKARASMCVTNKSQAPIELSAHEWLTPNESANLCCECVHKVPHAVSYTHLTLPTKRIV
eukprot:TRINITY_DN23864_c0_g1_i9.p1 TRINITY_DN23864_c0_g1~~TRINITY_DN23864_c0_g1_i9.p1  ORF type:complete len:309 (+),score=43.53 TRINITY_DN23864_c0_g1_i9:72-998(+)